VSFVVSCEPLPLSFGCGFAALGKSAVEFSRGEGSDEAQTGPDFTVRDEELRPGNPCKSGWSGTSPSVVRFMEASLDSRDLNR
jgi:hypothetical protein